MILYSGPSSHQSKSKMLHFPAYQIDFSRPKEKSSSWKQTFAVAKVNQMAGNCFCIGNKPSWLFDGILCERCIAPNAHSNWNHAELPQIKFNNARYMESVGKPFHTTWLVCKCVRWLFDSIKWNLPIKSCCILCICVSWKEQRKKKKPRNSCLRTKNSININRETQLVDFEVWAKYRPNWKFVTN